MTIKDIAKKAGVSVATVSRVFHNYKWVSPDLRERVQRVIEEEHYKPNYISGVMATGKSRMIIFVVPNIKNSFFAQFTSTAISLLKEAGYFSIVHENDNCSEEEIAFFEGPFAHLADGIISVTDGVESEKLAKMLRPLLEEHKPVLFIDRRVPEGVTDCVINDNIGAMYKCVKHLYEKGHRKIALVTGRKGITVVQDKMVGFKRAMESFGLPVLEEYTVSGNWDTQTGAAAVSRLLALADPPTAIIACNNLICEGAVDEITRRGLVTGRDISLIGTEESDSDIRMFSRLGITTLRFDTEGMALFAGKYILNRLKNEHRETGYKTMVSPMELIERNSVATINN